VTLRLTIRRAAQAEYDKAVDWYERQSPGLGAQFAQRVKEQLDQIIATPLIHGVVYRDIRKAVVTQFPYSIYYRVLATRIVVIAVFHGRRNPRIWQSRS
jgi:plasmid stabilization system protein ParE